MMFWPEGGSTISNGSSRKHLTERWERTLQIRKTDALELWNAASFFSRSDIGRSLRLVLEARRLAPDSKELRDDCSVYLSSRGKQTLSDSDAAWLTELNQELLTHEKNNILALENLTHLALRGSDWTSAESSAQQSLAITRQNHVAHSALGLVRLSEGAVQDACVELLLSVRTGVSKLSFTLAEELLSNQNCL